MRQTQKSSSLLVRGILLIIILTAVYLGYALLLPNKLPNNVPYELVIEQQQSIHKVANKLKTDGVISSPRLFVLLTRVMGKDKKVTAGLYLLKQPMSILDLINRITNGKPDQISITILDGWTFRQIRNYVDHLPNISHLTANMSESQIRESLKVPYPHLEGLLFPSTYFIAPYQSDLEIYRTAYKLMQTKLNKIWLAKNLNATNYSNPYSLLTMASLIQKETNDKDDMYQIATVFNNRLSAKMRLQDDPAVFYGLGNRDRITREDFQIDTPYNTYLHNGLPPTPICTPSENALLAAANPGNDRKILYFIAIGNGKSKFSYSYEQHLDAVNKYLKKTGSKK